MKTIKIVDYLGKALLAWFIFETFRFIYYGRFLEMIRAVPLYFNRGIDLWGIYVTLQISVAAFGILIIIPFLLRGHILGLIVSLIYWVMGNITNPLWFVIPRELMISSDHKATSVLIIANYFWAGFTVVILVAFYLVRRSIRKTGQQ